MIDPTSLQPLPQYLNSGLPAEIFYQPDIVGGSHGFGPGEGTSDDFWDQLAAEAGDVQPINGRRGSLRQRLNDFPIVATTVSQQALQYNKNRTYFAIQNKGAVSIFIAFGRPATTDSFEIPAGPGFYEPILGTVSSVHVIAAAGTAMVQIVEGFRVT